jgi:hypothetical protein
VQSRPGSYINAISPSQSDSGGGGGDDDGGDGDDDSLPPTPGGSPTRPFKLSQEEARAISTPASTPASKEETLADLKALFDLADINMDGTIDPRELSSALRSVGLRNNAEYAIIS